MAGRRWVRRNNNTTIKLKWKDEDEGIVLHRHWHQNNNLPSAAAHPGKGVVHGTRTNAGSSMYRRIRGRTRNGCKIRLGATQQSNGCYTELTGLPRRTRQHGIDVFDEEDMATRNCRKQQHTTRNCRGQDKMELPGGGYAARGNTKFPGGVVTTRVRGTNGYGNATIIAHNNST